MDKSEIVRAEDLDLTVAEVRRRWPQAVEYVGIDGEPCWRREDVAASVAEDSGEGRP